MARAFLHHERCESFDIILHKWSKLIKWRCMLNIVSNPRVVLIYGEYSEYTKNYHNIHSTIQRAKWYGTNVIIGICNNKSSFLREYIEKLKSIEYIHFVQEYNSDDYNRLLLASNPCVTIDIAVGTFKSRL